MIEITTVAGTWGWKAAWRQERSPLQQFLRARGFSQSRVDGRLFTWSTDINGAKAYRMLLPQRLRSDHRDWFAGSHNLCSHVFGRIPSSRLILWDHSHGLQVVTGALALGMKADTLIDVAGPVRGEFLKPNEELLRDLYADDDAFDSLPAEDRRTPIAELAARNVRKWYHFYDPTFRDWMQILGGVGDETFGIVKAHPLTEHNIPMPGAGHSDVLNDPDKFYHLVPVLDELRSRHGRSDTDSAA